MNIQAIIDFLQSMDKSDESYYQLYLILLELMESNTNPPR
jgi:hypothetical protein